MVATSCSGVAPLVVVWRAVGSPGRFDTHSQMSAARRLKAFAASTNAAFSWNLSRSCTRPPLPFRHFSWSSRLPHWATDDFTAFVSGSRSINSSRPGPVTLAVVSRRGSGVPGGGSCPVSVTMAAVTASPAVNLLPACLATTGTSVVPCSTVTVRFALRSCV